MSYYNPEEAYINFILPLSGRYRIFERFIKIYEEVCLKRHKSTNLYIVLYRDKESPEDFEKTTLLADRLAENYPYYVIKVIAADQTFSRGGALQLGINELQEDSLMLFIDVDMVFDDSMLLRIRHNTVQNKKVYFPIVYSLYNPKFLDGNYSEEMWMDSLHSKLTFFLIIFYGSTFSSVFYKPLLNINWLHYSLVDEMWRYQTTLIK